MRVFQLLDDVDVVQFDVEILINRLECASDLNIVLQLHRHLVINQRLEETGIRSILFPESLQSDKHT